MATICYGSPLRSSRGGFPRRLSIPAVVQLSSSWRASFPAFVLGRATGSVQWRRRGQRLEHNHLGAYRVHSLRCDELRDVLSLNQDEGKTDRIHALSIGHRPVPDSRCRSRNCLPDDSHVDSSSAVALWHSLPRHTGEHRDPLRARAPDRYRRYQSGEPDAGNSRLRVWSLRLADFQDGGPTPHKKTPSSPAG